MNGSDYPKEDFLQFLWQYQQFKRDGLQTQDNQQLTIIKTGTPNTHAGPDFHDARLIIDGIQWAGEVELHTKASDWNRHGHSKDALYSNVILHVVWVNDASIVRNDGSEIPVLELCSRVSQNTIRRYQFFKENTHVIPCDPFFREQSNIIKVSMIEKAFAQRMERKSREMLNRYADLENDFDELAYQTLSKNFGFKLNAEPFLNLARNLPLKIIRKYQGNLFQIEALLFGQAGFLEDAVDQYSSDLQKEYHYLEKKNNLSGSLHLEWKFLRTRPQSFPTVRLAQLAGILNTNSNLFQIFIEENVHLKKQLSPRISDYWENHYMWNKVTQRPNKLGKDSVNNILINTAVPLLSAYYTLTGNYIYFERAVEMLEKLPPEKNYITRIWEELGLKAKSAYESQALIEQYNTFCTERKCLSCIVGINILRK